ncbi:MAG: hypothetical protein JWS12_290 [Candidatus Saccharibacteria bacterium]|nr:hypothetical protein [Candidatus Saccharibacteria bacterium]
MSVIAPFVGNKINPRVPYKSPIVADDESKEEEKPAEDESATTSMDDVDAQPAEPVVPEAPKN